MGGDLTANAKKLPFGSWRALAYIGKDANGKRQYKSFTAPTKREAEFLAAEYTAKRKAPVSVDMKLAEAYTKYIEIKSNTLSPTTVREYKRAALRDFPELMQLKTSQITQSACRALLISQQHHTARSQSATLTACSAPFCECTRRISG